MPHERRDTITVSSGVLTVYREGGSVYLHLNNEHLEDAGPETIRVDPSSEVWLEDSDQSAILVSKP